MNIKTIYLDMDGVITDFVKKCQDLNCIEGRKVDWGVVHRNGADFWASLEWTADGKELYKWLTNVCKERKIDLCILTSVNFPEGIQGKQEWLDKNTDIPSKNRLIVDLGKHKAMYADRDTLLIDDFAKNIEAFIMAGGNAILYTDFKALQDKITEYLDKF